ncbi:MAG: hypothetical protein LLG14_11015 [Nocardiaceae bacterium]|nr:hypothetical protein [Nocardiaceae bacterium]
MNSLVTHGQVVLLARLLEISPESLSHLERLSAESVADLRERISRVFHDDFAHTFGRVATLAPAAPLRLAARFAQKRVPPRLAGRTIGALGTHHPKRSAALLRFVDPKYAARVAPHIDPRAVVAIAPIVDPRIVINVAREILNRRDYITAASLIMAAPDMLGDAVCAGEFDDSEAIKAAAYALSPDLANRVFRFVLDNAPERVDAILDHLDAADDDELMTSALSVIARCEPAVAADAVKALLDRGPDLVPKLARFWVESGYAADVIRVGGMIHPEDRVRVAQTPIINEPDILAKIVETVTRNLDQALWKGLVEILEFMPKPSQVLALEVLSAADPTALQVHGHYLTELRMWPPLLRTVAAQEPEVQSLIGRAWLPFITPRDMRLIRLQLADTGLGDQLGPLLAEIED